MELYEYLIGGRKIGNRENVRNLRFCDIEPDDIIYLWNFEANGTLSRLAEIRVTKITRGNHGNVLFSGVDESGKKFCPVVPISRLYDTNRVWMSTFAGKSTACALSTYDEIPADMFKYIMGELNK